MKDKLFTHSFRGLINYAKLNFLQSYKNECTMANCYICARYRTKSKTVGISRIGLAQ